MNITPKPHHHKSPTHKGQKTRKSEDNYLNLKSTLSSHPCALAPPYSTVKHTAVLPLLLLLVYTAHTCSVVPAPSTADQNNTSENQKVMNVNYAAVNCNSMNLSSSTKPAQMKKIYAIAKLKTDIILLSDIRLSAKNVSGLKLLQSNFATNPYCSYKLLHNSTMSKRGTGILIKNGIGISEEIVLRDPEENYIVALLSTTNGDKVIVSAIYGPNCINEDFFRRLKTALLSLGDYPIIVGGDWNCTFSTENIDLNIDCLNMTNLPNHRHSALLSSLCIELNLTDPYRYLWPNRKDFTFVPRNNLNRNRSRIDFFIISANLLPKLKKCYINQSLLSTSFDHKPVFSSFRPTPRTQRARQLQIKHHILSDPDLRFVVALAIAETYAHHIPINLHQRAFTINNPLQSIGEMWNLLRSAGPCTDLLPPEAVTEELIATRNISIDQLNRQLETINFNRLQNSELSCDHDIFMETLLNNVRNEVTSYQNFIYRTKNKLKQSLLQKYDNLRALNAPDNPDLLETECALNRLSETEITDELRKYNIFDVLNQEKITPAFLQLAKIGKTDNSLEEVLKPTGEPFDTDKDRNEYITNYYKDVYSTQRHLNNDISIENFLGPAVLEAPQIQSAKLTRDEAEALDLEISLLELDKAVSECRNNTAPGPDGFSYAFLKQFWQHFRIPLQKYATCCFNKGTLTSSFKTAAIRLIPKKGDPTSLKNWRPISLLNCIYKILSRALNNRLKTVNDKLTSRAQKGFSQTRQIQETLINVIEKIAKSNHENVPMAVLAIDQAKAFDSIDHRYQTNVLRFFGFGENFIRMIETATTGRNARIILPDGNFSAEIPLERGNSQGDCPSPILFNLCNQILLFKLELDPDIKGPFPQTHHPRLTNTRDAYQHESNRETDKIDAFADDGTGTFEPTRENILRVKDTLTNFAHLSGLECNFDKTNLMMTGSNGQVPADIVNLGFQIVDEIKLLGFTVTHNLDTLHQNTEKISEKILSIANYWKRFNLSLPGRISIAKTFMYAQISYISTILTPTNEQLSNIGNIINGYVTGNCSVAKDRITCPAEAGGLGLFDIRDYITGLQAAWVKRAYIRSHDNWSYDLKRLSYCNPLTLHPSVVAKTTHPILHNIAVSWKKFTTEYYHINNNITKSYILNNTLITRSREDRNILNSNFFNQNPAIDLIQLAKTKIEHVWSGNALKTIEDIETSTTIYLSHLTHFRLGNALTTFFRNRRIPVTHSNLSLSIENFLMRFKKGSRQFRLILSQRKTEKQLLKLPTTLNTFFALIDTPIPDQDNLKKVASKWQQSLLPNRIKDFYYKFTYNKLPINTRLSHMLPNSVIDRACTFCSLCKILPAPEETFVHLFWHCTITQQIYQHITAQYIPELGNLNAEEKKNFFFTGINRNSFPLITDILRITTLFQIWEMHQKKKVWQWATFRTNLIYELKKIAEISKTQKLGLNTGFHISTNWNALCPSTW